MLCPVVETLLAQCCVVLIIQASAQMLLPREDFPIILVKALL